MKPSQLKEVLTKCVKAGLPVMLKGAPGVGKTDICHQTGDACQMETLVVIPAISDPTDGKGVPGQNGDGEMPRLVCEIWGQLATFIGQLADSISQPKVDFRKALLSRLKNFHELCPKFEVTGHTEWEWKLIGDARRVAQTTKPMLVLIDDLGQAPGLVQAAYMQWILLRRIGEHQVPDCVTFVACTNRRQDRAGVTGILEPVKSRFVTILEMTPDEGDWAEWAYAHGMPPKLIAFAHFRPALLTTFKPTADIVNGPCPRTFANAGKLINAGVEDPESLAGAVGEGCAVEMASFFRFADQTPNLDAIIADPKGAEVPTEPAVLYAVVSGLVEKVGKNNVNRIFRYGSRLPEEYDILLGRDCLRKDRRVQNTQAFTEWGVRHKDVFLA